MNDVFRSTKGQEPFKFQLLNSNIIPENSSTTKPALREIQFISFKVLRIQDC